MSVGGAETFVMKNYRMLDKNKYQIDFLTFSQGVYDNEIRSLGGKVYYSKSKSKNVFKTLGDIKKTVKENRYNNVLRISQNAGSVLDLLAAKAGGARHLIFRSSNSNTCGGIVSKIVHTFFKIIIKLIKLTKVAPSSESAIHMFGKNEYKKGNVIILPNAIPLNLYEYNEKKRKEIRSFLGIPEKAFVLGHVGRFERQKNHKFLISLFKEFTTLNKNKEIFLLLIGGGSLFDDISNLVKQLSLQKTVIILKPVTDVNFYYSAIDVFVFPSLFEGMPNTLIEAQASKLTCLVSDTVTKEAKINDNVFFLSLEDKTEWLIFLDKYLNQLPTRNNQNDAMLSSIFNIDNSLDIFISTMYEDIKND